MADVEDDGARRLGARRGGPRREHLPLQRRQVGPVRVRLPEGVADSIAEALVEREEREWHRAQQVRRDVGERHRADGSER